MEKLPFFLAGLNIGMALMLFIALYSIYKWQTTKKEYEELRSKALSEISKLRKQLSKYEGGK